MVVFPKYDAKVMVRKNRLPFIMLKTLHAYVMICIMLLLVVACGDSTQDQINHHKPIVVKNFQTLESKINNKKLRNILILEQYAIQAKKIKPDLTDLINILSQDATIQNPNLLSFKKRLQNLENLPTLQDQLNEVLALKKATNPEIYNETLIDTINVISGLTDGQLPSFDSNVSKNNGTDPGAYLVGNPSYGYWNNSSSNNFWVWYGGYRMLGDLFGGPHYYHRWHNYRPWSYYHDYGRDIYGGYRTNREYSDLRTKNDRAIKQYARKTGRNVSSYGNRRTNSRFVPSRVTQTTRTSSSYTSTQRNSFSRSRGFFGGK